MKRSKFNLSYTHLSSFDGGELIPIGLTEALPGDSIRMNTSALVRCAPMLSPPMHPVSVRIHHWFVPHRLVWTSFEDFITGGPDGLDASVFPTRSFNGTNLNTAGTLGNYLGLPIAATLPAPITVSALPYRVYDTIWNEYYRDQDLQSELVVSTGSGNDTTTSLALQNCAWEKDYLTSSRPWEQKGAAQTIPISGSGTVLGIAGSTTNTYNLTPGAGYLQADGSTAPGSNWSPDIENVAGREFIVRGDNTSKIPAITANLTSAGVTINALRQTLAIQRYEEARARYGSRYAEYLLALGVRSSDARLSRPEYLGGGRQTLQFSEVLQTAADGANPVSTLRGHGISALRSNSFQRFFEEHGYIMTLMSVLPKTIYSNALPRTWNRRTKFDFWQKELESIGQQPVLNKEVRIQHATPDGTFGYQDRYDEYRRSESRVSGEFATSTLNFWHFARDFASDPALNATFVSAVPPERSFAVPANDVFYVNARHSIKARRLVSQRAIPKTF